MNPGRLTLLLLVVFIGCKKHEPGRVPLARLDDQTLTLDEVQTQMDTAQGVSQTQVQHYIQNWLREELLYQEAVKRGLDQTEEINRQVETAKRELAINALLEQTVYAQGRMNRQPRISMPIMNLIKRNLLLQSDVALLSLALFKNRDAATEFRNAVVKKHNWDSVFVPRQSSMIAHTDSQYCTQTTQMPPELWRVAANAAVREPSFPINTKNGYYVIIVWKFNKQGETADERTCGAEIRSRLVIEKRRLSYKPFLPNFGRNIIFRYLQLPQVKTAVRNILKSRKLNEKKLFSNFYIRDFYERLRNCSNAD